MYIDSKCIPDSNTLSYDCYMVEGILKKFPGNVLKSEIVY